MMFRFRPSRSTLNRASTGIVPAWRQPHPRKREVSAVPESLERRVLFSVVYSSTEFATFNGTNGLFPEGPLVDKGGNLFGVAATGGPSTFGTVFEITAGSGGTVTSLYDLGSVNAKVPAGGLIADGLGNLFGVSQFGGTTDNGSVYEIATGSNAFSTVASFSGTGNQISPTAEGPLVDVGGNLYGVTNTGGMNGTGEVFEIAAGSGAITDLSQFASPNSGGAGTAVTHGLAADLSGNLYGVFTNLDSETSTIFKSTGSTLTTLATFTGTTSIASDQNASLIIDSSGNLFGAGGTPGNPSTIFELPAGASTITTIATGGPSMPSSPLVMDSNGDLFGATATTAFELVKGSHTITTIATFPTTPNDTSSNLQSGVVLDSSGDLFVTVPGGGTHGDTAGDGAIYELVPHASPPAALTPTISGKLPASVVAGQKTAITQTVTLTNTSGITYDATETGNLFLSTGTTIDSSSIELPASISKTLRLKAAQHTFFKFSLKSLPSTVPSGTYHLLAQATDSSGNYSVAASSGTITIAPPQIDLSVSLLKFPSSAKGGAKFSETIVVNNLGNIAAKGSLPIVVDASPNGQLTGAAQLISTGKSINIAPGKSVSIRLSLTALASGTSDFLISRIDPNNTFSDINLANNIVVSPSAVTFI